jgi:hypothetical protein
MKRPGRFAMRSPWGDVQQRTEIAPGIVSVSTEGHGGFMLSPQRVAELPDALRGITTFAGPGWFEEDCDASIVILGFPQFFPAHVVRSAVAMARGASGYLEPMRLWIVSADPRAAAVRRTAEEWDIENADRYRVACCGSTPRRWEAKADEAAAALGVRRTALTWVALVRVSDSAPAEALVTIDEYRQPVIDLSKLPESRILIRGDGRPRNAPAGCRYWREPNELPKQKQGARSDDDDRALRLKVPEHGQGDQEGRRDRLLPGAEEGVPRQQPRGRARPRLGVRQGEQHGRRELLRSQLCPRH